MRQNFVAQFIQLLKNWLCIVLSGIVMKKNWTLSVDHCQLQVLPFSVHLSDLLEKAIAPHSSSLAWKILWMEEPGRLQSMGSPRVGHD